MTLYVVVFVVTFAAVFGLCIAVARRREDVLNAKQELITRRVRSLQVAETRSDDMWRANKRLTMR